MWPTRAPNHDWRNGEDISDYGSKGRLLMNVLDEMQLPRTPPREKWRGKLVKCSKFGSRGVVKGKFWLSWYPWPLSIPSSAEWENQPVELPNDNNWRGLELRYDLSEVDMSMAELVIIKILKDIGPSPIQKIWPRFASRVNTRGMGAKDLVNKLESMPSVRRVRKNRWKYVQPDKL